MSAPLNVHKFKMHLVLKIAIQIDLEQNPKRGLLQSYHLKRF